MSHFTCYRQHKKLTSWVPTFLTRFSCKPSVYLFNSSNHILVATVYSTFFSICFIALARPFALVPAHLYPPPSCPLPGCISINIITAVAYLCLTPKWCRPFAQVHGLVAQSSALAAMQSSSEALRLILLPCEKCQCVSLLPIKRRIYYMC